MKFYLIVLLFKSLQLGLDLSQYLKVIIKSVVLKIESSNPKVKFKGKQIAFSNENFKFS